MKLLLDENVDVAFRHHLAGNEVFTVAYMGWKGLKNGELIARAAQNDFEILISTDRGLSKQQNRASLPIGIIIMLAPSNDLQDLVPLAPKVLIAANAIQKGQIIEVGP